MFGLSNVGTSISCGVMQLYGVHDCDVREVVANAKKDFKLNAKILDVEDKMNAAYKVAQSLDTSSAWDRYYKLENKLNGMHDSSADPSVYIFSDNDEGNGEALANAIKKAKIGKIVSTGWVINKGTGSRINTWVWHFGVKSAPKATGKKK